MMSTVDPYPVTPGLPLPEHSLIAVTLVFSRAERQVDEFRLQMPRGSSLAACIGQVHQVPEELLEGLKTGACVVSVWGNKTTTTALAKDGDRIEICRPLKVDPKVARRERFNKQGSRRAGLFTLPKKTPPSV